MPVATEQNLFTLYKLMGWCDAIIEVCPSAADMAHTVIEDYNFEDWVIDATLGRLKSEQLARHEWASSKIETMRLLKKMQAIPEADRIWPEDGYILTEEDMALWEHEQNALDGLRAQSRDAMIREIKSHL